MTQPFIGQCVSPTVKRTFTQNVCVFANELWIFTLKEAQACLFAGSFFTLLVLSKILPWASTGIHRYDFLFVAAILMQAVFVLLRIESWQEVKVIFLFHIIGMGLELFKTSPHIASWSYPEPAFFKLYTVPLYSGFMYSAVGSYINQAWKIFKLHLTHHPPYWALIALSAAIYTNFFTHHFIPDFRYALIALTALLFWKTRVYFTAVKTQRVMPLLISFLLIGFFIWVGENIATYFGAWEYPGQAHHWSFVSLQKIICWFLLVIISFNIISTIQQPRSKHLDLG